MVPILQIETYAADRKNTVPGLPQLAGERAGVQLQARSSSSRRSAQQVTRFPKLNQQDMSLVSLFPRIYFLCLPRRVVLPTDEISLPKCNGLFLFLVVSGLMRIFLASQCLRLF